MITEMIIGGMVMHIYPTPPQIKPVSFQTNIISKIEQYNFLLGHNSIGKFIYGAGYDFKVTDNLDFKVGGYVQDRSEFENLGVYIPTGDFMPVIGFEMDIPMDKDLDLTTIVMPPVVFVGVSVNF